MAEGKGINASNSTTGSKPSASTQKYQSDSNNGELTKDEEGGVLETLEVEKEKNISAEIEKEEKKLWVDVISGSRLPANGLPIEFYAPT